MGQQEKDFHVGLMRDDYAPTVESARNHFDIRERYTEASIREAVRAMRESPEERAEYANRLRQAFWVCRQTRHVEPVPESFESAVDLITEYVQLMDAAGWTGENLRSYLECLSHGCTCPGCDLANGERFVRGDWL